MAEARFIKTQYKNPLLVVESLVHPKHISTCTVTRKIEEQSVIMSAEAAQLCAGQLPKPKKRVFLTVQGAPGGAISMRSSRTIC